MRRLTRLFMFGALIAALVVPIGTVSATSTVTYGLSGAEYAATATQGSFAGVAWASDDYGVWQAVIDHSSFVDGDAVIAGGTFVLHGKKRDIGGTILPGGAVHRLTTSDCGKETFHVTGTLAPVGSENGFAVLLTHYRYRTWSGRCITYFATVRGSATFTLP